MPSTRSGRTTSAANAAPNATPATNKRKADAISPSNKESKSERPAKEQKTIEETFSQDTKNAAKAPSTSVGQADADDRGDNVAKPSETGQNGHAITTEKHDSGAEKTNGHIQEQKPEQKQSEAKQAAERADIEIKGDSTAGSGKDESSKDEAKASQQLTSRTDETKTSQPAAPSSDGFKQSQPSASNSDGSRPSQSSAQNNAVQDDSQRKATMPSNILEKGIIYFFTRGRVGIDEPENVQDLQRSFFVLRPLPRGGKLTDGGIQDAGNNRLFALPKKVWPKSGRDRFMVFVEKAKVSMSTLKEEFFQGSEYSTQTSGVRHTPPVTPIGEGVYAITSTGGGQGTTHLAYMLTIPEEPGQVQSDVGITNKGSFVLSLKNPESSGPSYASLPQKPDYPKEFIDEFRGRGWMPVEPKHLDYPNAQLLLIGENFESSKNLEANPKDEQDGNKKTPEEELQKLEDEDEHRVDSLKGDDTIFVDLGISKQEYAGVQTTW